QIPGKFGRGEAVKLGRLFAQNNGCLCMSARGNNNCPWRLFRGCQYRLRREQNHPESKALDEPAINIVPHHEIPRLKACVLQTTTLRQYSFLAILAGHVYHTLDYFGAT